MSVFSTQQQVSKELFRYHKNVPDIFIKTASVPIVRKASDTYIIRQAIIEICQKENFKVGNFKIPLTSKTSNPKELYVFPNIPIDNSYFSFETYVPYIEREQYYRDEIDRVFRQLRTIIKDEKQHPQKKIKWENATIGMKFLLKRERISVFRYLTKYCELPFKDDQIRLIGDKLMWYLTEPEVVFCKTPDDYVEQHKTKTGSCMQWYEDQRENFHSGSKNGNLWNKLAEKYNAFPSVWYHYNPEVQGVYLKGPDGFPSARAFIFNDKEFATCYGPQSHVLKDWLKKKYKSALNSLEWKTNFKVPGYEHEGKYYCPLPYHDNIRANYYCKFDPKTNEFIFMHSQDKDRNTGTAITYTYNYYGYIPNDRVLHVK